jgi:hypothetical protein
VEKQCEILPHFDLFGRSKYPEIADLWDKKCWVQDQFSVKDFGLPDSGNQGDSIPISNLESLNTVVIVY